MIRAFVAIELSQDLLGHLKTLSGESERCTRWQDPEARIHPSDTQVPG